MELYEKPIAELIEFELENCLMTLTPGDESLSDDWVDEDW